MTFSGQREVRLSPVSTLVSTLEHIEGRNNSSSSIALLPYIVCENRQPALENLARISISSRRSFCGNPHSFIGIDLVIDILIMSGYPSTIDEVSFWFLGERTYLISLSF